MGRGEISGVTQSLGASVSPGVGDKHLGGSIGGAGAKSLGANVGASVGRAGAKSLGASVGASNLGQGGGDSWKSPYLINLEQRRGSGSSQPRSVGRTTNAEINGKYYVYNCYTVGQKIKKV